MAKEFRSGLPTDKERRAAGRALREKLKRSELGRWRSRSDRPDPVDLIEEAHSGRLERLIPVRVGRMVVSPYAFLRGAASLMAEDFDAMPRTGVEPVICGDAHLGNFGFYASPERNLVFEKRIPCGAIIVFDDEGLVERARAGSRSRCSLDEQR